MLFLARSVTVSLSLPHHHLPTLLSQACHGATAPASDPHKAKTHWGAQMAPLLPHSAALSHASQLLTPGPDPLQSLAQGQPPPRDYLPLGTIPHGCYPSTCCGVPPDKTTRGTLMTPKAILREGQQGLLLANLLQHCTNTQQKAKKPTPNLKCRPHSSHPMPSAAATNPEAPGW